MRIENTSLFAFILIVVVLMTGSCSTNQQTQSQQTSKQKSTSQTPESPATKLIQIVFDMGQAAGPGVDVYKGDFKPPITYQPPGTIVTWQNDDTFLLNQHSVTSNDGLFDKDLNVGESFNYTFTKLGTYDYYCKLFPDMKGGIIIE